MPGFALILPAAGRSTRFGSARSKLLEPLAGLAVIARALEPFLHRDDLIQVVIPCSEPSSLSAVLPNDPRLEFCLGGDCRAQSVRAALLRTKADIEWIAIHDAARPLISPALIESTLHAARQHGVAAPALPIALTVKQATGPLPAPVVRTVPRESLWSMQTPQIARRTDLLAAFENCPLAIEQITDDVQLLELSGHEVWLISGDERNLKITTTMDLRLAELWLGM